MTNVGFSRSGPPNTVLPEIEASVSAALASALADPRPRTAVAELVAQDPELLQGWAALGRLAEQSAHDNRGTVEAYAYYRIGYHRGLDALRKNGWKGSGYVRWDEPSNHGFLRCLDGLRRMAEAIDEGHEAERCAEFLGQLDPKWTP